MGERSHGAIVERKAFIRSLIKKITIDYPTATIEYTIPMDKDKKLDKEVLVINSVGCPELRNFEPLFRSAD